MFNFQRAFPKSFSLGGRPKRCAALSKWMLARKGLQDPGQLQMFHLLCEGLEAEWSFACLLFAQIIPLDVDEADSLRSSVSMWAGEFEL